MPRAPTRLHRPQPAGEGGEAGLNPTGGAAGRRGQAEDQRGGGGDSEEKSQGKEEPEERPGGVARRAAGKLTEAEDSVTRKGVSKGTVGPGVPLRRVLPSAAVAPGYRGWRRRQVASSARRTRLPPSRNPTHLQTVGRQYTGYEVVKAGGPHCNKHALHREDSRPRIARIGCDVLTSRELRVQRGRRKLATADKVRRELGLCGPMGVGPKAT